MWLFGNLVIIQEQTEGIEVETITDYSKITTTSEEKRSKGKPIDTFFIGIALGVILLFVQPA